MILFYNYILMINKLIINKLLSKLPIVMEEFLFTINYNEFVNNCFSELFNYHTIFINRLQIEIMH